MGTTQSHVESIPRAPFIHRAGYSPQVQCVQLVRKMDFCMQKKRHAAPLRGHGATLRFVFGAPETKGEHFRRSTVADSITALSVTQRTIEN